MKLKLTVILFFVAFGLYAQKEVQPYNYTRSDKEGKNPQTIMIYASAEAVNNVTFTLKNAKNEILKDKDDKEITFKVFPFTEVPFREHLVDAFLKLDKIKTKVEKEEDNKQYQQFVDIANDIKDDKSKTDATEDSTDSIEVFKNRRGAIQEIRNVYQFFSALINTAFQYDTEPIAGVLKYENSMMIIKDKINGQSTEKYFKRLTKPIKETIVESKIKDDFSQNAKNLFHQNGDPFIAFLNYKKTTKDKDDKNTTRNYNDEIKSYNSLVNNKIESLKLKNGEPRELLKLISKLEINTDNDTKSNNKATDSNNPTNNDKSKKLIDNDSYLENLYDYYKSISNKADADEILETYINEQLKKWYTEFAYKKFVDKKFANSYFKLKYRKSICEAIINEYSKLNKKKEEELDSINGKIKAHTKSVDSLKTAIKNNAVTTKSLDLETALKKAIKDFEAKISNLGDGKKPIWEILVEIKKQMELYDDKTKGFQNDINFLIVKRKNQIVDIPFWRFQADNIQIDFNDGFIEHISVTGKAIHPEIDKAAILNSIEERNQKYYRDNNLEDMVLAFYNEPYVKDILKDVMGKEYEFKNGYPIGFSSKTDFSDLSNYPLYTYRGFEKIFKLPLTNVIKLYVPHHENDRLDFSPKDQTLRLPSDDIDNNKTVELKKEKSFKLLNAKIFTDFNGFKENEPNGLVQIEIEKFIPLWTKRKQLWWRLGRNANYGIANYVNFHLNWAKVNEEDRSLQVKYAESFQNNESVVDKYITYLDLVRFENVTVGLDLNALTLDFPQIKIRAEINAGLHFGRVKVVDTLTNADGSPRTSLLDKKTNIIRYYPDVIVRIRPEERFGGYIKYKPFRTIVPNNEEFFTVGEAEDFEEGRELNKNWLHRFELGAFFRPAPTGDNKFFFRYRYTNTSLWKTNGYSEMQLGYQIYLKF